MKTLVILGNGFDLNIGLRTSYRHFIESEEFKSLLCNGNNYIIKTILSKFNLYNWVDIEEELKQIAKSHKDMGAKFKSDYIEIVKALARYLTNVQDISSPQQNTVAGNLLSLISEYPHEFDVFSFNYTDLNYLCRKLGYCGDIIFSHVHGSLDRQTIILGFEDNVDGIEEHSYMIKSFNSNYVSRHLRQKLKDAKEIIIFGHSLGSTDYQYFSEFFKSKSAPGLPMHNSVRLSIITANENSKIDLMRQLKKMNANKTNILLDQNDVRFYYTSDFNVSYSTHHLFERLRAEILAKRVLIEESLKRDPIASNESSDSVDSKSQDII